MIGDQGIGNLHRGKVRWQMEALCVQHATSRHRLRQWRGNAGLVVALMPTMTGFTWVAVLHAGAGESTWLLLGYAAAMTLCSLTAVPLPRRLGIGSRVDHWAIHGARASRERYTTAYIVGCCLYLELLEITAQHGIGGPGLPAAAPEESGQAGHAESEPAHAMS